jgi:Dolichyl-phosphate-mannose-protein mannosyltransferase
VEKPKLIRHKDLAALIGLFYIVIILGVRGFLVGLPSSERQELSLGGRDAVEKALPMVHQVLDSKLGTRSEFLDKTKKQQFAPLAKISPYIDQIRSFHPDEQFTLKQLSSMAKRRSLKPDSYIYSPFFYYQIGASLVAGRIFGAIPSETSLDHYLKNPDDFKVFYLCGRILCAFFGIFAVLAVYLCARRLACRPGKSFFAAALVASLPLVVTSSRFIKPEAPTLFYTALALFFSIGILRYGRWRDYILSGICIGLAGATKYPAVFCCLYALMYHVSRRKKDFELKKPFKPDDWKLVVAGLIAGVTFLVLNPTILVDLPRFLGDLQWITSVSREGNPLFNMVDSIMLYCYDAFFYTMGFAAFTVMIAGIVYTCIRPRRAYILMFPVIAVFAWLAAQGLYAEAYLIPTYVPLSLLAARAVFAIKLKYLKYGIAVFVLIMTFGWSSAWNDAAHNENARISAVRWINKNIPAGSSIAVERYPVSYRVPMFDPNRYKTVVRDIDGEDAARNADYYIDTSFQWLNVPFYERYAGVKEEKLPFENFSKIHTVEYVPKVFGLIPLQRRCRITHYMEVIAPVIIIYKRKSD